MHITYSYTYKEKSKTENIPIKLIRERNKITSLIMISNQKYSSLSNCKLISKPKLGIIIYECNYFSL